MDSDGQKAVALSRRTDLLTAQPGCASRIELAFVTIVTLWSPPRTEIGLSSPGPWRHPDAAGPLGCWAGNGNAKPSRGHERPGRARRAWRLGPHGRDAGLVPVHEHAWVEDAAADVRLPCAPRASATFGGLPRMVGKLGVFLGMSSKRNSRNLKRTGARKRRPMETDLPAYLPGATEFTEIARFLEWLYICLRHGWIGSHRYRNLVHTPEPHRPRRCTPTDQPPLRVRADAPVRPEGVQARPRGEPGSADAEEEGRTRRP
jgi:hypothetical protein